MKNKFYSFVLLCFCMMLFSCESNSNKLKLAESKIDDFYNFEKVNDYKSIDNLMNYQFYQVTPYNKFVNFLKVKKEVTGDFKIKKLKSSKIITITNSNDRIILEYETEYIKKKTSETFVLEKNHEEYQILNYSVN